MTTISEFRCEICGTETTAPVHWFLMQCGSDELKLVKWNTEAALAKAGPTLVMDTTVRTDVHLCVRLTADWYMTVAIEIPSA
jgi:hypothetical protein